MIQFPENGKTADIQDRYTREDLIAATNEQVEYVLNLVKDLPDECVTYRPVDPDADDPYAEKDGDKELAWNLAHVILHVTASGEEGAARGASLARGVLVTWRDRYEPDWRGFTRTAQLIERLEDSRQIRLAYLEVWPREPHLDNLFAPDQRLVKLFGKLNAVGMTLQGLKHEQAHFEQIHEIIRQAREALG